MIIKRTVVVLSTPVPPSFVTLWRLEKPCQKSLPPSLFQREESFLGLVVEFLRFFPPLEKGSWEKSNGGSRKPLSCSGLPISPSLNFFTASGDEGGQAALFLRGQQQIIMLEGQLIAV
jgi:hypothetical protein